MLGRDSEFEERLAERRRCASSRTSLRSPGSPRRSSPSWSTITIAVERGAQDRVLASFARGQRALGPLARGHVHHRRDARRRRSPCASRIGAADVLTSISEPSRCSRRRSRSRHRLALARSARGCARKKSQLVVRDDRADAADRLVRPSSRRSRVAPAFHERTRPSRSKSTIATGDASISARWCCVRVLDLARTARPARARSSPGSRRRAGSATARRPGAADRRDRRPRCSRCARRDGRAAGRRASGSATRAVRDRRVASE